MIVFIHKKVSATSADTFFTYRMLNRNYYFACQQSLFQRLCGKNNGLTGL